MIYMVISWPFLVRFCGSPNDLIKWFFNSPTIALEIIKLNSVLQIDETECCVGLQFKSTVYQEMTMGPGEKIKV